ncbi:alpha-1,2-fucosyltransferase [Selenomonas ruminantium]|uniref:Glycosyl transferase family 11 n=1 Tax=Selenomonas ruminantium TaxID=971 RepID=A0A1I0YF02_SELRU|nr:alpha-1,2-fucosyltransferase [Selenomonas ruminantium]SFB11975.1 Glycosyl transferase family 11 [Selenomonas ruminantium]
MHIVYINGGLGNQIFQYMFYCWLRKILPQEDIVLDDGKFWGDDVPHQGYELKRIFGIEVSFLSERFTADVWMQIVKHRESGVDVPEQLLQAGMDISVIREDNVKNIRFSGDIMDYRPGGPLSIPRGANIYWHGYWLTDIFYENNKDDIRNRLVFPAITDEINSWGANKIAAASEPTAIHIRRGDMAKLGWSAEPEYFADMISRFDKAHNVSLYLLFSDDISWCRESAEALGLNEIADRLVIVDHNHGANSWRDLQLMTMCKHRLSDRSSFSLLAGILCEIPGKEDWNRWC